MTKSAEGKWRSLIAEQEQSGLSARAFAESRGLSTTTLYWWRNQLKRPRRPDLVAVRLADAAPETASLPADPLPFELVLDQRTVLRIPRGFDEADLSRLLRALRC